MIKCSTVIAIMIKYGVCVVLRENKTVQLFRATYYSVPWFTGSPPRVDDSQSETQLPAWHLTLIGLPMTSLRGKGHILAQVKVFHRPYFTGGLMKDESGERWRRTGPECNIYILFGEWDYHWLEKKLNIIASHKLNTTMLAWKLHCYQ